MSSAHHAAVMAGAFVVLVVVAFAVWRPPARRTGRPPGAVLALLLAAAVCVSLTLPDQVRSGVADRLGACVTGASARAHRAGPAHHAVNVLLWVPLGASGVLVLRRPLAVVLLGSTAWALLEPARTLDPLRSCRPVDRGENTLGLVLGVCGALGVLGPPGARGGRRVPPGARPARFRGE